MRIKRVALLSALASALLVSGCANVPKTPVMGVVGGVVAKSIGGDGRSVIVGMLIGGAIGLMMDKQEAALKEAYSDEIAAGNVDVIREGDTIRVIQSAKTAFAQGSYIPKEAYIGTLAKTAQIFKDFPDTEIRIEGHASSEGSRQYNETLSVKRAMAMYYALNQMSVAKERMKIYGFGEDQPRASNDTAAGRNLNRRVEMVISPYAATDDSDI